MALERQVADLKRRNEELQDENGRRARKDDENATLLTSQRAQQQEQVGDLNAPAACLHETTHCDLNIKCNKGAAQHSGSILTSHPAAPGLIPGSAEIFSRYILVCEQY